MRRGTVLACLLVLLNATAVGYAQQDATLVGTASAASTDRSQPASALLRVRHLVTKSRDLILLALDQIDTVVVAHARVMSYRLDRTRMMSWIWRRPARALANRRPSELLCIAPRATKLTRSRMGG